MLTAIVLGAVVTAVALTGLLGREPGPAATRAQLVVYALPLGIVAYGYAAGVGIDLSWALVAAGSVFASILAGGLLGHQPAVKDQRNRPGAAGLNLVCSGLISLGLGAATVLWASQLIAAFSYLDRTVVGVVLVLAGVAYAVGGRSAVGLSRLVVVLLSIGAIGMFAIGYVAGDISGLSAPEVPVPSLSGTEAVLYAVGVVLVGAGYPVLRSAGAGHRSRVLVAAVVVTLVSLVTVIGILALYGGAFQLPSLVINVLPVYSPKVVAAVVCALLAVISTVIVGATIHTAGQYVGVAHPSMVKETGKTLGSPRLWLNFVLGLALMTLLWLAPAPGWIILVLATLAIVNLLAEITIVRGSNSGSGSNANSGSNTGTVSDDSGGADVSISLS